MEFKLFKGNLNKFAKMSKFNKKMIFKSLTILVQEWPLSKKQIVYTFVYKVP